MQASRAFRPAPGAAAPSRSDAQLTVVSYNILAQKYVDAGYHGTDAWLSWSYRQPRILAELDSYAADVICLQEVEEPTWQQSILPHFKEQGFEGVYYARQSKPNEAVPGPPEGCALLMRSERLNVLASKTFRFAEHVADLGVDSGEFFAAVAAREDGAVMAVAEETSSQRRLVLACTHLFWNPKFPDVKAAQASLLVKQIQRFGEEHGLPNGRPLILGGDFNSLARKWKSDTFDDVPEGECITSGAYELLSTGKLPASSHDHPSQRRKGSDSEAMLSTDAALTSAYAACLGREPPITNSTAHFRGALDYIWFAGADDFSVDSVLEMPYADSALRPDDVELQPIPDDHFPSDHLAIAAKVQLLSRPHVATQ